MVTLEDGTEQRIAVLGEDLREVSPGFLPRSLDDLRMRRANDAQRPENRFRRRRLSSEQERADEPLPSLENELDRLLEAASEPDDTSLEIPQRPAMPDDPGHSSQLVEVDSSPVTVPPRQSRAAARRERFARIFGTREDIERDDYESPIASMYYRAYTRYLEAEETRAAGDTDVAEADSERHDLENQILQSTIAASRRREPAPANVPRGAFQTTADWSNRTHSPLEPLALQDPAQTPVTRQTSTAPVTTTEPVPPARETREAMEALEYSDMPRAARAILENVMQTLDLTPRGISIELDMDKQNRPPPLEDADMTRSLSCRVCYSQLADVALLPCGHMVLCTWCADTIVPVKHSHIPISSQCACPVCKKTVKQRYRIHM